MKIWQILESEESRDERQLAALMAESNKNLDILQKNSLDFDATVYVTDRNKQQRVAKRFEAEKTSILKVYKPDIDFFSVYVPHPPMTTIRGVRYIHMDGFVFYILKYQYNALQNIIERQRKIVPIIDMLARKLKKLLPKHEY